MWLFLWPGWQRKQVATVVSFNHSESSDKPVTHHVHGGPGSGRVRRAELDQAAQAGRPGRGCGQLHTPVDELPDEGDGAASVELGKRGLSHQQLSEDDAKAVDIGLETVCAHARWHTEDLRGCPEGGASIGSHDGAVLRCWPGQAHVGKLHGSDLVTVKNQKNVGRLDVSMNDGDDASVEIVDCTSELGCDGVDCFCGQLLVLMAFK